MRCDLQESRSGREEVKMTKNTFTVNESTLDKDIAVFIMSMAKPSVPAAGIVCLSSVFQAIGVAPEAVEIVLCITPVLHMFNTAAGACTNVTSTTILASMENCISKSVFNK